MTYSRTFQCNKCGDVCSVPPDMDLAWGVLNVLGAELFGPSTRNLNEIHLCRPCVRKLAEFIPSIAANLERFFDYETSVDLSTKAPLKPNSDHDHIWNVIEKVSALAFEGYRLVIENPERWEVWGLRMDHETVIGGTGRVGIPATAGIPATVFGPSVVGSTVEFRRVPEGADVELAVRYVGKNPEGERLVARIEGKAYGFSPKSKPV